MDRYWYHNLLVGAVKQASLIEKKYAKDFPEMGLGLAISKESPHTLFWKWKVHSKQKFAIFYGLLAFPLILLAIFLSPWSSNRGDSNNTKNSMTIIKSVDTVFVNNKGLEQSRTIKHMDTTITILDSSFNKR